MFALVFVVGACVSLVVRFLQIFFTALGLLDLCGKSVSFFLYRV